MKEVFKFDVNSFLGAHDVLNITFTDENLKKIPSIQLFFSKNIEGRNKKLIINQIIAGQRLLESDLSPLTNFKIKVLKTTIELSGNLVNALKVLKNLNFIDEEYVKKIANRKISSNKIWQTIGDFIKDSVKLPQKQNNKYLLSETSKLPSTEIKQTNYPDKILPDNKLNKKLNHVKKPT